MSKMRKPKLDSKMLLPHGRRADALVSICITSYNYAHFLRDAIDSALAQTYPHIEVVISDNASTDATPAVLAEYANDERVRVFVNDSNVGLCRNHNLAIERSRGEYIVVLSADDVLFSEHVDTLLQRILDPYDPVLIAHGQGIMLNESLRAIGPLAAFGALPLAYSHRDDFGNILFFYHHLYPAKLVARSVYERVGLFNERMQSLIDIEISARIEAADIPSAFVPKFVAGLRAHERRTSTFARNDTNVWMGDKLNMIELGLDPEHAWRIEGYEAPILSVLDLELRRLAEQGCERLSDSETARLIEIRRVFAERAQTTAQWPPSRPQLSVVVLSEGYVSLLQLTLEALAAQKLERLEIIVVQSSGCEIEAWVASLPYAERIRVVQVRACDRPARAFRYGLELARGEYVTYLSEGQRVGDALYAALVDFARGSDAHMVLSPKESIDDAYPLSTLPELHPQQFADPATRAAKRANSEEYGSLCQFLHRRSILRAGSGVYESMIDRDEATFLHDMAASFRTVALHS